MHIIKRTVIDTLASTTKKERDAVLWTAQLVMPRLIRK